MLESEAAQRIVVALVLVSIIGTGIAILRATRWPRARS
jgi:hypothetical protein